MTYSDRNKPTPSPENRFFGFRSPTQTATILYVPAYELPVVPASGETPPDEFLAYFPAQSVGVTVASLEGEWTERIVLE